MIFKSNPKRIKNKNATTSPNCLYPSPPLFTGLLSMYNEAPSAVSPGGYLQVIGRTRLSDPLQTANGWSRCSTDEQRIDGVNKAFCRTFIAFKGRQLHG